MILLCAVAFCVNAQKEVKHDYVITKKGVLWEGRIMRDVEGDTVTLLTKDSLLHYFPYTEIRNVKYGENIANVKVTVGSAPPSTRYNEFLLRKRRVGMGLTITGAVLTTVGTIMIIANPANTTTYSGRGNAGVTFHNVAAVGFVLDLAGIPMLIAGAVKWARMNKVIANHPEISTPE